MKKAYGFVLGPCTDWDISTMKPAYTLVCSEEHIAVRHGEMAMLLCVCEAPTYQDAHDKARAEIAKSGYRYLPAR